MIPITLHIAGRTWATARTCNNALFLSLLGSPCGFFYGRKDLDLQGVASLLQHKVADGKGVSDKHIVRFAEELSIEANLGNCVDSI